jgi:hypothetical protein
MCKTENGNGPRRARKAIGSRCLALMACMLLVAAPSLRAQSDFGSVGLALKSGAAAGPMGIQLSWNFSPHLQASIGGGGTSELLAVLDRSRTDSYFLLAKYYLKHLYLETGYSLKTTKAENVESEKVRMASRTEQGIPVHVGYEFGHRRGFFFATAVGYHHVIGGGGVVVSPRIDANPGKSATSAESGFTAGASVGYYLF